MHTKRLKKAAAFALVTLLALENIPGGGYMRH